MNVLRKIEPINRVLEGLYGLRVDIVDAQHLLAVMEHYGARRDLFVTRMGDEAYANSEYRKCHLIHEAARIILKEIQPKRRKNKPNAKRKP